MFEGGGTATPTTMRSLARALRIRGGRPCGRTSQERPLSVPLVFGGRCGRSAQVLVQRRTHPQRAPICACGFLAWSCRGRRSRRGLDPLVPHCPPPLSAGRHRPTTSREPHATTRQEGRRLAPLPAKPRARHVDGSGCGGCMVMEGSVGSCRRTAGTALFGPGRVRLAVGVGSGGRLAVVVRS